MYQHFKKRTMENLLENTLASIVRQHHATAPVFEKYHLDYCCNGKRTLSDACAVSGIDADTLVKELEAATVVPDAPTLQETDAVQLIAHIILKHHFYVRQSIPAIAYHLQKVISKHGGKYPHMSAVGHLFSETATELTKHMQKEETILFPRIQQVYHSGPSTSLPDTFLSDPIAVMEAEHTTAGNNLYLIRSLTNNYTPPEDACTTHRLLLDELQAFENDLHQHVHLENNVLFPLGEKLLKEKLAVAF